MHTSTLLWGVWFTWGLWILTTLYPTAFMTGAAILFTGGILLLFLLKYALRGYHFMRFLKRESTERIDLSLNEVQAEIAGETLELASAPLSSPTELPDMVKPIKTCKDTFLSSEARLTGNLEGQSNVVIEGRLQGNVSSSHQVRVESGGVVVGDINAQHITINGRVEGRLYADAFTLQSQGHVQGEIFTDALIIEKGGVFIGQSHLKSPQQVHETKVNIFSAVMDDEDDNPGPGDVLI